MVVSGDESRGAQLDTSVVVEVHSTNARGYWLVDRANGVTPAKVTVEDTPVGGGPMWCAAGPCALESLDDAISTGLAVREQGAHALRIGIFKPRTGRADAVARVALAAAAFGVDGLLIETHTAPERMCRPGDGQQAYDPTKIGSLVRTCATVRDMAAGY